MDDEIPQWMKDHIKADADFQRQMTELIPKLATKADLKVLATEKSVRSIVHLQRNIMTGITITSRSGRFIYRAAIILAPFLVALGIITGVGKAAIVWVWVLLFGPK